MAKKVVQAPKKEVYVATAKILGRTFTAKGSTVREAIENLKVGNAKGRCIISMTHGDVTKERILNVIQTSRLFTCVGMPREVTLKNISLLFDGI